MQDRGRTDDLRLCSTQKIVSTAALPVKTKAESGASCLLIGLCSRVLPLARKNIQEGGRLICILIILLMLRERAARP